MLANGEAVSRYGFIHALYRNVLYERLSASRCVQLHRRMGEQSERIHGEGAREIAAELAMHFERGANNQKAVKYIQQAANNEIRRFAYRISLCFRVAAWSWLRCCPTPPRAPQQELLLQLTLGVPLVATEGYAAPDVGSVYRKARELWDGLGRYTGNLSSPLGTMDVLYIERRVSDGTRKFPRSFYASLIGSPYPGLAMRGHWAMEITHLHLGQCSLAIDHFEKALRLYDPERHLDDAFLYAQNPGVAMRCFAAWAL